MRLPIRALTALVGLLPCLSVAQPPCDETLAEVVSVEGVLELRRSETATWQSATPGEGICPGDLVRVGPYGRAALRLPSETVLRLGQGTTLRFPARPKPAQSVLELLGGALHTITRTPRRLEIDTPYVNAAVEGTEFTMEVDEDSARVTVLEGRVLASNPSGRVRVDTGHAVTARRGTAPSPVAVVRPRHAVAWALYYPPVIAPSEPAGTGPGPLAQARDRMQHGQPAAAVQALDAVPETERDTTYFLYRASLLLHTGQVEAARAALARAEQGASRSGALDALRAIIALVQGDDDRSLQLARTAARQAPHSAAAWIALSYARQAQFDLPQALASAERAVAEQSDNGLAHARVAELRLALGRLRAARAAAMEAVRLSPELARSHTVLGFARLIGGETALAQRRFARAIDLDQADPLPRLGAALADIRRGRLLQGRKEMETAVALDPGASLPRSYLGKAYYQEKRDHLASTQYALAKQLDPRDPTPWLYDAILKQVRNRPGEALQNLQRSIELNDNRAVYSSRLALDRDAAARGAAQARVYEELGFDRRAEFEAQRSIRDDPANADAHRFLAQSFADQRRFELARASEALQSQLLQPLSLTPVPPSLAATDLNILSGAGPSVARLNEYNPLFVRDQMTFRGVGVVGSHRTRGDEMTVSGIEGNTAWSGGQFHYQTDGFRTNNDLEDDIYNLFVQTEISPRSSLQAEVRKRQREFGDLGLRFDPTDFSDNLREDREEDTFRLGHRYQFSAGNQLVSSFVYQRATQASSSTQVLNPVIPLVLSQQLSAQGDTAAAELQYRGHLREHRLVAGGGYYRSDVDEDLRFRLTAETRFQTSRLDHGANAHGYDYFDLAPGLGATLGLSADRIEFAGIVRGQLNPKLGLDWQPSPNTTVRAAAFRTLKRELTANQTVEPTQVAGFTQFFDDVTGTDARRYGVGVDQRWGASVYGGVELSARDLDVPRITGSGTADQEHQTERLHRAYLYWQATARMAVGVDAYYEQFDRDNAPVNQPSSLRTWRVPFHLTYHHPNGLFAKLIPTYFDQRVDLTGGRASDRFWVVDAQIGYRLPRRLGVVSVETRNAFDNQFQYYDSDFQSGLPRPPIVQPERAVFLTVGISID